jgi:hypothetical protein
VEIRLTKSGKWPILTAKATTMAEKEERMPVVCMKRMIDEVYERVLCELRVKEDARRKVLDAMRQEVQKTCLCDRCQEERDKEEAS